MKTEKEIQAQNSGQINNYIETRVRESGREEERGRQAEREIETEEDRQTERETEGQRQMILFRSKDPL